MRRQLQAVCRTHAATCRPRYRDLHTDKFERHQIADFMHAPCPESGFCPRCGYYPFRTDFIIIAVDGACRDDGRSNARVAYGVYINIGSQFNMAGLLDEGFMTNQRAKTTAAIETCTFCCQMLNTPNFDQKIRQVTIKSDSAYLVNSMVMHVEKWRLNGYTSARGLPVVNGDILRGLDECVVSLEEKGVDVRFWHVPRSQNKQADKLANAALDGVDHERFTVDNLFD